MAGLGWAGIQSGERVDAAKGRKPSSTSETCVWISFVALSGIYFAGTTLVLRRLATSHKKLGWLETVFSPCRSAVAMIRSGG